MRRVAPEDHVPLSCLALFTAWWGVLAVRPVHRPTWLLENLLTFVVVPLLVLTYRRFRLGDRAYVHFTIFLVLHTLGSHYTYSLVPLGEWLPFSRNHYDRLVHFSFGVLLVAFARDLFLRGRRLPLALELFLAFCVVTTASVVYELIEWGAATVADPDAGIAFLGIQGDQWDTQKDMALACLGASLTALREWWRVRAPVLRALPRSWTGSATSAGAASTAPAPFSRPGNGRSSPEPAP